MTIAQVWQASIALRSLFVVCPARASDRHVALLPRGYNPRSEGILRLVLAVPDPLGRNLARGRFVIHQQRWQRRCERLRFALKRDRDLRKNAVRNTRNKAVTWSASAGRVRSSGLFIAPVVSSTTEISVTATGKADSVRWQSTSEEGEVKKKRIEDQAVEVASSPQEHTAVVAARAS